MTRAAIRAIIDDGFFDANRMIWPVFCWHAKERCCLLVIFGYLKMKTEFDSEGWTHITSKKEEEAKISLYWFICFLLLFVCSLLAWSFDITENGAVSLLFSVVTVLSYVHFKSELVIANMTQIQLNLMRQNESLKKQ